MPFSSFLNLAERIETLYVTSLLFPGTPCKMKFFPDIQPGSGVYDS